MDTWHEDDRFWELWADKLFSQERWEAAPDEIEKVTRLLNIKPGEAVLDLGCGPGRHSLALARRGFQVTGVDRTSAYLTQARQAAEKEGLEVEFVHDDMRRFLREVSYQAVISLYTSFGYFEDPEENKQVLINAQRSLCADGAIILDLTGKEVLARTFRERDWHENNGILYLEEREIKRNWSWIENRWIMVRDGEQHEFQISHWLYSAAELAGLLEDCGFGSLQVYGSLEGTPYDLDARRLVIVGCKRGG